MLHSATFVVNTEDQQCHMLQCPYFAGYRGDRVLRSTWSSPNSAAASFMGSQGFAADLSPKEEMGWMSERLISVYEKHGMGTSTLKSGLTSWFWKALLNKRKEPASTPSIQCYLPSGKPNYTHYTDEEALVQSCAFAWLQIPSESVAKLEIHSGSW